ncbi:hypothetical protein FNV58_01175 (plasmid) [Streptomyces sp. RLB1-9]|uniref:hypothetical protein n=1 Tax=Streptomyces sp. RLB1-9 TaxID=2594454 RepID=UPI001163BF4C|nr:hypothetical protein [Streptomyces sp. RLB1-9]QDN94973.1 hypothetical protein FNV58_01175 [Streptomyces sp. RLB1-9]
MKVTKLNRYLFPPGAVTAAVLLLGACSGMEDKPDSIAADVMCHDFVEKQLKSPGTAKFAGVTDYKYKTLSDKKPWKFRITSWVDSQNPMGGVVRNPYVCTVSTKDNKTWHLDDLQFTNPN